MTPAIQSVSVNGEIRHLTHPTTVEDVVLALSPTGEGCAVALNGAVVPRSDWACARVADGDRVEVLTAAQGG